MPTHETSPPLWINRVRLLDDAPIDGSEPKEDVLNLDSRVELYANTILKTLGPMVLHVDGAWGRGKTSFCKLLERKLAGLRPKDDRKRDATSRVAEVRPAWYIASDEGAQVADAILYTVATAVTGQDPEESRRVLRTWGTNSNGAAEGDLVRLEGFRNWAGRELGWLQPDLHTRAGEKSKELRVPLSGTKGLIIEVKPAPRSVALIFVDDLDRCRPERVVEVLEAVRTYVACPGVVFVIAADRAVVTGAFRDAVESLGASATRRASDALEKYIRHRVTLPGLGEVQQTNRTERLQSLQKKLFNDETFDLLRGPRGSAVSDGIGVMLGDVFRHSLSVRRLKLILNRLASDLAAAADRAQLRESDIHGSPGDSELGLWNSEALKQLRISYRDTYDGQTGEAHDAYRDFFVSKLVRVTGEQIWPDLLAGCEPGSEVFRDRVASLAVLGENMNKWPESLLELTIDRIVPPLDGGAPFPLPVKREMCEFLAKVLTTFGPGEAEEPRRKEPVPEADFAHKRDDVGEVVAEELVAGETFMQTGHPPLAGKLSDDELMREAQELIERLLSFLGDHPEPIRDLASLLQEVDLIVSSRPPRELQRDLLEAASSICEQAGKTVLQATPQVINLAYRARQLSFPDLTVLYLDTLEDQGRLGKGRLEDRLGFASHYLDLFVVDEFSPDKEADPLAHALEFFGNIQKEIPKLKTDSRVKLRLTQTLGTLLAKLKQHDKGVPDWLEPLFVELADPYYKRFVEEKTPQAALDLARIEATRDPFPSGFWEFISGQVVETKGQEFEFLRLKRFVADALAGQRSTVTRQQAVELYESLQGSRLWTPTVLHNLATLHRALRSDPERAGRLWEAAYRAGSREPRLQRSFSQFLRQRSEDRLARAVMRGDDLPKGVHPFGAGAEQENVQPEWEAGPDDE